MNSVEPKNEMKHKSLLKILWHFQDCRFFLVSCLPLYSFVFFFIICFRIHFFSHRWKREKTWCFLMAFKINAWSTVDCDDWRAFVPHSFRSVISLLLVFHPKFTSIASMKFINVIIIDFIVTWAAHSEINKLQPSYQKPVETDSEQLR